MNEKRGMSKYIILSAIISIISFLIFASVSNSSEISNLSNAFLDIDKEKFAQFLSVGIGIIAAIIFMFRYLEGNYKKTKTRLTNPDFKFLYYKIDDIGQSVKKFEEQLEGFMEFNAAAINKKLQVNENIINDDDKNKIINSINNKIDSGLAENINEYIKSQYEDKLIDNIYYKETIHGLHRLRQRLIDEINTLSRRANLNLAIGSTTTLIAVVILWLKVANGTIDFGNAANTLSHFIPRISLVIFIEIFSFFFLRLYKANLSDIKYYQNEMTNADFKIAAIKASLISNNENVVFNNILELFSKTERNFVLKKDETTIELEKLKQQEKSDSQLFDIIRSLTNPNNKKN